MLPLLAIILISTISLSTLIPESDSPFEFNQNWTFNDPDTNTSQNINLPKAIRNIPENRPVHLTNTLPDMAFEDPTLFFRTEQQYVTIMLNQQLIYEYKPENKWYGHSPGSAIHFVKLPSAPANATLDLFLTSPYKSYSGIIEGVSLGSKSSHILTLLKQGALPLIVSMTILFLGIVLFIAFLTLRFSGMRNAGVLYLALFCFFSGIWMASESKLLLLFLNDPILILNTALVSLFCLPVPLLLFINRNYQLKCSKAITLVTLMFMCFLGVATLLQLLNLADFVLLLPIFHAISIFAIIIVGLATLKEVLSGNKRIYVFFIGCVTFSACILGDIALYYFSILPNMGFNGVSLIGTLIFILITTTSLGENLFQIRDMQTRNRLLLSLAYCDGLTGLKNRTSFEEMMSKLNEHLEFENSLHMIILDINNLKRINDTFGHKEGDRLITEGAEILNRTLGRLGEIYRIGGDEFSIIVRNLDEHTINNVISELFEEIDQYNQTAVPFKMSIAYGMASFKKGSDKDLNSVFVRADKAMYHNKVNQKQIQVIG